MTWDPKTWASDDQKAADALVGKTIRKVLVAPGEEHMVFETDAGDVVWGTDADCCSETWFADLIGYSALCGGKVEAVTVVEMDDGEHKPDGRTRQEEDAFYGFKIKTDKGDADIIYRNSSNGYYGGNAVLQEVRPAELVEITGDWQAGAKVERDDR